MRVGRKAKAERVPVRLAARVTEVGTVELWCQSRTDDRRWRLQIQLRGPGGTPAAAGPGRRRRGRPRRDRAVRARRRHRGDPVGLRRPGRAPRKAGPARLIKRLEEVLDVPARPVAPLGPPGLLGAAPRPGRAAAQGPAARVALVQPGRLLPPARDRASRSTRSGSRPSGRSSTRGSSTPRTCSAGPSGGSSGGGSPPA